MEISYGQRTRLGQGRPQVVVPPALLEALKRTYDQGVQAEFPLYGASDAEVKQVVRLLEHGVKQIGGGKRIGEGTRRLRWKSEQQTLKFYMEDRK